MNSQVIIVGGGLAGLSAALYLARAKREVLVLDSGRSMARWEPDVQNFLGFPEGIGGPALLERGRKHAAQFGARFVTDTINHASGRQGEFVLKGENQSYRAQRLLLATGLFHRPPEIPKVNECLGKSMFFCKDCDGFRVHGKPIAIIGNNNETVEYALSMLHYSPQVAVATNGKAPGWDETHGQWLREYQISVYQDRICEVDACEGQIGRLIFESGPALRVEAVFTTRGDVFHNQLAQMLGADLDEEGQVRVDHCMRTNVPGLYAAGCLTPANCQMIIAAGQGATAAQAINRDLFEESLRNHQLRRFRDWQKENGQTEPPVEAG